MPEAAGEFGKGQVAPDGADRLRIRGRHDRAPPQARPFPAAGRPLRTYGPLCRGRHRITTGLAAATTRTHLRDAGVISS